MTQNRCHSIFPPKLGVSMIIRRLSLMVTIACLTAASAPEGAVADTSADGRPPPAVTGDDAAQLSAREAGARYGQALGVLEICLGSKVTSEGNALGQNYTGADQDVFKTQAAKIYEAWRNVKNCNKARDPNVCKIIMDKSCAAAEKEIGPNGTVLPGLVEFMKH